MNTVVSLQGETLDNVTYRYYRNNAMLPFVIAANRRLSALPTILPTGTVVNVPDEQPVTESNRLWGPANE